MRTSFEFFAPTDVRFGVDRRLELADVLENGTWGVISTPGTLNRIADDSAIIGCAERGITLVPLGTAMPNPQLADVEAALARAREQEVAGVLAIGGGSAMDAAKLLAAAYRYGVTAREALESLPRVVRLPIKHVAPLVVMPTTAGTGAEVSQGAIISDATAGRKRAARGRALIPTHAIIDPRLSTSLDSAKTAEIGFDIIAHAIETYLSRAASQVTDILARAALDAVPGSLVHACRDGSDIRARSTLSLYSWLMGYNLAHASTCLPHRMQYPVGARTDSSHQIGLAAVYPAWFAAEAAASPSRVYEIIERVSLSFEQSGVSVSRDDPGAFVRDMLSALGIATTLSAIGLSPDDAPALTAAIEGRTDLDPLDPTSATIERLYRASF